MKFLFSKFVWLIFIIFVIVLFFNNQFLTLTTVFSQGDDNKKGGGFGIQERERDRIRIHAENNSQIVNADLTSIILFATIIVIIGVSSYALYKIYLIKRKSNQSKPKK